MESLVAATTSPPSATALFSLQVAIDALSFRPPASLSPSLPPSPFVLAFQLLQFDIVLFEASSLVQDGNLVALRTIAEEGNDDAETTPPAQSCLFECDAQRLACDIQSDADAALVLLVLQRDAQRARLVAFACVRLELPHLAFSDDGRTPRVSEWASVVATWPLVDHQRVTRGSVRGAVTLACLGRALAPHLAVQQFGSGIQALATSAGVRVKEPSVAGLPEPRQETRLPMDKHHDDSSSLVGSSGSRAARKDDGETNASLQLQDLSTSPPKHEEPRDAAVQCDDPDDGDEREVDRRLRHPKSILIRGGPSASSRASESPRLRVVDELDRLRIGPTESPKRRKEKRAPSHRDRIRVSYEEPMTLRFPRSQHDQPFLEAELPPPLFFHKPKQPQSLRQSSRS